MSDDPKSVNKSRDKSFDFSMMPFFGLDLGRELGSLDSRLTRVENDIQKLSDKIDAVDAKLTAKIDAVEAKLTVKIDAVDSRVDKCLVAINRLDERVSGLAEDNKSNRSLIFGLWATVIAGIILQYFVK